ncbi:MAG: glycosyltransferase family 4 protein [Bacteroidaceae bacterium]|nr:glycosyltransferase family 4 protein [Bacteroidaceae bacterium]
MTDYSKTDKLSNVQLYEVNSSRQSLIVVSAVNLRKGGTLAILQDCLQALSAMALQGEVRVVALVHRRSLCDYPGIEYIELPWSVRSWVHRLWCEYVTMHGISLRLGDIDLWLSLHDTTPCVKARHQAVYCHNSYPFFRWHWRHLWQNYRIVCFALFTRWFYRINLHRNDFVIVQQSWFRDEFAKMFCLDKNRIVVFPPKASTPLDFPTAPASLFTFLYPAYPDVHKNFECVCEAAEALEQELGRGRFEVVLTTTPEANRYSHWLHRKWGHVSSIRFCGFVPKEQLLTLYAQTDCLIFPSHVETWGLPISEFAATGRPMLLADLPYAHETAAGSQQTAFFNPDQPRQLQHLMRQLLQGDTSSLQALPVHAPQPPIVHSWREVVKTAMS